MVSGDDVSGRRMIYEINILSTKERLYQAQAKNNLALDQNEINIRILNSNCGRLVLHDFQQR